MSHEATSKGSWEGDANIMDYSWPESFCQSLSVAFGKRLHNVSCALWIGARAAL
jgi:hypothetical protein